MQSLHPCRNTPLALVTLLAAQLFVQASSAPNAQIDRAIREALDELVNARIDPRALAASIELPYPVPAVTAPLGEVEAKLKAAAQKKVNTTQSATTAEIERDAIERYPLYKTGDTVALTLRRGFVVKGTLRTVAPSYIIVGSRRYAKVDLTDETRCALDASINQAKRERYIRNKMLLREDRRQEAERLAASGLASKIYLAHGYMRYKDSWRPARPLFNRYLAAKRKRLRSELRQKVENELYPQFGYRRQSGRWVYPTQPTAREQTGAFDIFADPDPDPPPAVEKEQEAEPEAPPAPAKTPRARDTVLDALKKQGAVEHVPPAE
ncbi:MAG TPA: hypothetical protein DCR55_07290 [Lentisphaeria bacterium]|nr:hypothetical protein [Lentisphaeria bacterium]